MKPLEKGLGIGFALVILTILVYHVFRDRDQKKEQEAAAVAAATAVTPPPPPTKMDYLPVQENFAMFRSKSDEDDCHFLPDAPRCKMAAHAAPYGSAAAAGQEGFTEGMASLGDFSGFLNILLEMLWLIVYILITLPEHILAFAEGSIWLILAGLDIFIEIIYDLSLTFYDLIILFSDITRCGLTWSENLPTCLLWYLLDVFIYLLVMVFIWLPIMIIRIFTFGTVDVNPMYLFLFGVKGYPDVDQGYIKEDGILAKMSHMCYRYTGYEFIHFPDFILNKCYSCDIVGDLLNLFSDVTTGVLRVMEYFYRDVGHAIPLFWHASYLDMLFNPPGPGQFPPGPPLGGGLEKYQPPPVPPRLAGAKAPGVSHE